jgi:hypothetical protein
MKIYCVPRINSNLFRQLIIVMLFTQLSAFGQVSVEWSETYRDSLYSNTIAEALKDSNGNIICIGTELNTVINESNPYVIKYNSSGSLEFKWSLNNVNLNAAEAIGGACLDSVGNIYIAANVITFPVDTGRFIKIDGITGQEIFNIPFINELVQDVMVYQDNVYVLVGISGHAILKYDLAGNNIYNQPIQNFYNSSRLFNWNQYLGVLGESYTSSTNSYTIVERYSWNGNYIDSINVDPTVWYDRSIDFKVDVFDHLWLAGQSFDLNGTYLTAFIAVLDTNGIIKDTTFTNFQLSRSARVDVTNSGVSYVSIYSSSPARYSLFKYDTSLQFLNEVDSVFSDADSRLSTDVNAELDNKIITVNRRRKIGNNGDYEISCFDTVGSLIWNYIYELDSTSREIPFKIITDQNDIYIVGMATTNGTSYYGTNILKLNLLTGLQEINSTESILIYPNPTLNDIIHLNKTFNNAFIQIFNMSAIKIFDVNNFNGDELVLPSLKSGVYLVEIQEKDVRYTQKIIKQ